MPKKRHPAVTIAAAILGMACAGCTGASDRPAEPGTADERTAPTSATAGGPTLTSERLRAYERGLRKEIDAVRAAQQRSGAAATPRERGEAIQASFEDATIPQGAAAAGLAVDDYRDLRSRVNAIFRTLDMQGKIDGPISMDLSRVDAATKERLARDPFADLPAESADALRAEMDRLVPVWIEYVRLVALAG